MKSIAFYVFLVIVGGVMVYVSRALSRHDESELKWDLWTREFIQGPPGYQRAILTLLGYVLIIVGVIGSIITIVSRQ